MNRFVRNSRLFLALLFAVVGIVSPLAPMAAQAGSTPWRLDVGVSNGPLPPRPGTNDQAVQANYFNPRQVWVHVGDSVEWTWRSGEIHTLTFLNGNPRPTLPAAFGPLGGNSIPESGVVSSGALGPGATYTLMFTTPGNYTFNCLLHRTMSGVVHVRPVGQALPHPDQTWYNTQAMRTKAQLLQRGQQVQAEGLQIALAAGANQVNVGFGVLQGTGSFSIMRFQPDGISHSLTVPKNTIVTFTNRDPDVPHTVTFGVDTINPDDRIPATGSPVVIPGTFDPNTQTISSGALSNVNLSPILTPRGSTFQVTFEKEGKYHFKCLLHDELGMEGVITVTP